MWCKEDLSAGMHRMDSQMTWFEWGAQRLVYSIDTPGLPASALNLQITWSTASFLRIQSDY